MNGTFHETEVSGCMNKRRLRIIKYVAIAVAVMVFAWGASAIAVYAVSSGRVFDSASIDAVPRQRAAVVMGCVRTLPNGLNNLYFSRRIDAAAELYKAGKVDCLIVSGDNHVKGYDEPSDMKESLAKAGVPADRIVCDYAGFRTLDTVVRAKKVFGLDSFIIVSQPDHVRRAVFTARGFGCDAYGYAAKDVNGRYSIKTTIREQLAKIAAVLDVILRRSPKFLGPRETLPPPVEEGDVLNPPENREPTSGTVAVDPPVYNVLWWLKAHQQKNGSWNDGPCPVTATALGICAFLAHGEFPYSPSPYAKDFTGTVIAASEYVMGCVSETNGVLRIRGGEDDERSLPIVTMALCELYGMTRNPDAKENAVLCLRHLVGRARSGLESGKWQKKDELLLWTAEALWAGKANMKLERHFGKEGKNRLDELCANLFELTSGLNDNGYCGGRRRYWAWMSADATKKDGEEYFNWRRGKEAAFVKALKEDQEKITDTKGILHSKGFLSESIDAKPSGLGVSADSALSVMELMIGGGGMRNLPIIEESSDNAQPTNDDVSVSVEI